jgi:hypothetical protein
MQAVYYRKMPRYPGTRLQWANTSPLQSNAFTCGFCGNQVASSTGYFASPEGGGVGAYLLVCHLCTRPTLFEQGGQFPGVAFGELVDGISDKRLSDLYEEARRTTSASAYTAAVLCCRKLLMHIAVEKGASQGLSFVKYVEYLAEKNYIPPDAKSWVDHIRTKSNEANHEIVMMSKTDAEELVSFSEMLLKVIYEFPAAIKRRMEKPSK